MLLKNVIKICIHPNFIKVIKTSLYITFLYIKINIYMNKMSICVSGTIDVNGNYLKKHHKKNYYIYY